MQDHVHAIRKRIGANVRRLREARHWSQDKLAELVGNSQKHIGQIERGEVNTRINVLIAIAYRLTVSVPDLFVDPGDARQSPPRAFTKTQRAMFEDASIVLQTLREAIQPKRRRRSR